MGRSLAGKPFLGKVGLTHIILRGTLFAGFVHPLQLEKRGMRAEWKAPPGKVRMIRADSLDEHVDRYDRIGDYSDRAQAINDAKWRNENAEDWIAYMVFDDRGKMICGRKGELS